MSFTKRKENRLKAWDKRTTILKKYSKQPLIKNVDVEELKKQFATVEVEVKPKTAKKVVASEEVSAPVAEAQIIETVPVAE